MKNGFTLIEILIVVAILGLLMAGAVPGFQYFQKQRDLGSGADGIMSALRLARSKTLASQNDSPWGVYFFNSAAPNEYVLFNGSSYAERTLSLDEVHFLPVSVAISQISLSIGQEVVFSRLSGNASSSGSVVLQLVNEPAKTKTIYVSSSGQAGLTAFSSPSDSARIKDSRHIHFNYSRIISAPTEKITLIFGNPQIVSQEINIAENMRDGQIYWSGEVDVAGTIQKLKIHTHWLNSSDTQLCIDRDRRYNDKFLKITISGDGSGSLIEYSADGLTTQGGSIYTSSPQLQ